MVDVVGIRPDTDAVAVARSVPRPRAIIFDWDNTLVDTWPCIGQATNITLARMGHAPWSEAELRLRIAGSLRDTFPKLFGNRWEEARDVYYKAFEDVHLETLAALPGAEALLKTAAEAGLYLGVVSNKTGKYLRTEVTHLGWDHYFGRLVGAQDAARDKPAPDPVLLVLRGADIPAGPEVWFVGDAPVDVECGRAAGCTTILLHDGKTGEALPHVRSQDCDSFARVIRAALAEEMA
jgi:phosphoglycolate phosphatase